MLDEAGYAAASEKDVSQLDSGAQSMQYAADDESRDVAPGLLDRRKSTRPSSVVHKGGQRGSWGPRIPIKVDGVASPLASPTFATTRMRPASTSSTRSSLKATRDGNVSPGESSASDANHDTNDELRTSRSTSDSTARKGNEEGSADMDTAKKPRARARVSVSYMKRQPPAHPAFAREESEGITQPPAAESRRQEFSRKPVPGSALASPSQSEPSTPANGLVSAVASDQEAASKRISQLGADTSESSGVVLSRPEEQSLHTSISMTEMRTRLQSHRRNDTADTVQSLGPSERAEERDDSPVVNDSVPSTFRPESRELPNGNYEKRLSSAMLPRISSSQGASVGLGLSNPQPFSETDREPFVEERTPREQPAVSPPPTSGPGYLARTASTRIAGLLGKMNSMRAPGRSPEPPSRSEGPGIERRDTAQSTASVPNSGNESLSAIADEAEDADETSGPQLTLQDQFRNLRQREETSWETGHEYSHEPRNSMESTHIEAGVRSPASNDQEQTPRKTSASRSTPGLMMSPPVPPSLPPGTALGLSAGPADEPRPVDWDLWQAVVYEGPAAVARTSGDELNQAIASGIPAALRGVVWQVLAGSKNVELEKVYRRLKHRGSPTAEQQPTHRPGPPSRKESGSLTRTVSRHPRQDSQASSSRSSRHSRDSTPATSAKASQSSPALSVQGDETESKPRVTAQRSKRDDAELAHLERSIRRDLGSRTSFSKYAQAAGLQDGLFGVCKAYALYDEGVGYVQGITFLAMPLLFNMAEEEAFTLLVRLMSKYDVRSMFTRNMYGLHLRLYQFERLLEDNDPALYCHLRRRHVAPQLYATQWFLTLFAYRFPLQLVLRVYDMIFSEGLTAVLKFGLVLMLRNRDVLLEMKDMAHLTEFLKEGLFDVYIDKSPSEWSIMDSGFFGSTTAGADKALYRADEMVRDACDIKIPDEVLEAYTAEWEEQQRASKAAEFEIESLRYSNTHLSAHVRALEERTQQQDTEHVTLAGDVVRYKVENDELLDENEGLKIKVSELRKLLDTQPDELEEKFKHEMGRIVARNVEVQNENRVLREEQEELEEEIIAVKTRMAQTQQDFDGLMKKWQSVQAMLSDR